MTWLKASTDQNNYFGLKFIATSAQTAGKYFQCETIISPHDQGPPEHIHHNEDEAFLILEGELLFYIDDQVQAVKTGDYINIVKGSRHTWKNVQDHSARAIVTFSPGGIENMFTDLHHLFINQPTNFNHHLKQIGQKFGTEFFV